MSTCGATRPFRFSTDDAPAPQRAEAVRAMHERSTLPSKPEPMEPLPGCQIRVDVTQWALPGLGILAGTLWGVRQLTRSKLSAPAGADSVFFGMTVTGSSIFRQRHGEVLLHGGDGFLANRGDSGFSIARPRPTRFIGLRFPRAALAALVPDLDCPQVRIIPRASPALSLLKSYLSVVDEAALTTPDVQRLVISQVYDLTALAIGVTRDRMMAAGEAARAARLQVIKSDHCPSRRRCSQHCCSRRSSPRDFALPAKTVRDGAKQLFGICARRAADARSPPADKSIACRSTDRCDRLRCRISMICHTSIGRSGGAMARRHPM